MKRSVTLMLGTLAAGIAMGAVPAPGRLPSPEALAAAKTPAQHEVIAKEYLAEARVLEKIAVQHRDLAKVYAKPGMMPGSHAEAMHCREIAAELSAAAKVERKLASEHEKMALRAPK